MTKATFFPIGNADCTLIETANGKLILVDYGNMASGEDDDNRVDLSTELAKILNDKGRDYIDVVAFTHLDKDHYNRFSEFFFLDHATKYQDETRIKINELWVPASIIIEYGSQVAGEGDILRAEARYRFIEKSGIRVFSKPELLKDWLDEKGEDLESRLSLISTAGNTVEGFTVENDGIEIFIHAPFTADIDEQEGDEINRNDTSLIMQVTFLVESGKDFKLMLGADSASSVWEDIIKVTEYYNNENRLEWDMFKLPHHCSYRSLNEDKDNWEATFEPTEPVKRLFSDYARDKCIIISSSNSIEDNQDTTQPPHKEAAEYYKKVAEVKDGEFIVTMESPSKENPSALEIQISSTGYTKSYSNKSLQIEPNELAPLGNTSHAQPLQWNYNPICKVNINAYIFLDGKKKSGINSDGRKIPTRMHIKYIAKTNASPNYDVFWQVVNTGAEASKEGGLRGEFFTAKLTKGEPSANPLINWETTQYHGKHWIQCFIVKDSICIARSEKFYINI